jgi:DNA polymerase-3 subunit delta'
MNRDGITGHKKQMNLLEIMLNNKTIPQGLLFHGIEGIGKQLVARRFLNALFCREENAPCLRCGTCLQFSKGIFPDMVQIDPGKNGTIPIGDPVKKEEGSVRWLVDILSRKSVSGRFGVIINGIERVSREGIIALLKTIEEPQEGACIILISENRSQVIPTILSRCMEVSFNGLQDDDIDLLLTREGIEGKYRELAIKISGGSAGLASLLTDEEVMEPVLEICSEISSCVNGIAGRLHLDFNSILKKVDASQLLNILQNIYRYLFISQLKNRGVRRELSPLKIEDSELLKKIIKIFLALREGLSNNLNIRNSMKGMIYSMQVN